MHGALIAVRSAGLYLAVLFFLFGETECNRANLNGSAICFEPSLNLFLRRKQSCLTRYGLRCVFQTLSMNRTDRDAGSIPFILTEEIRAKMIVGTAFAWAIPGFAKP